MQFSRPSHTDCDLRSAIPVTVDDRGLSRRVRVERSPPECGAVLGDEVNGSRDVNDHGLQATVTDHIDDERSGVAVPVDVVVQKIGYDDTTECRSLVTLHKSDGPGPDI